MKIKEKIKKFYKPCKRLKLLEYEEFLEKEELNDTPTSRAMYCEYKSQVDEKNQKADMCLSQKIGSILFAIVLTIVIICLFVNQISATTYFGWSTLDYTSDYSPTEFLFGEWLPDDTNTYGYISQDYGSYSVQYNGIYFCVYPVTYSNGSSTKYGFVLNNVEDFQRFLTLNSIDNYSQFVSFINNYDAEMNTGNTKPPLCDYYLTSTYFELIKNYSSFSETDILNAKKEGVSDSIDVASDLLNSMGILYEPYPNNGSLSTLDSLLSENIGLGLQASNTMGYNSGLARGETVFRESQEFQDILDNEYEKGKNKGEETAPLVESSLRSFFNAPINFISNILNFEIFGINLWAVFTFILTLGLVFFIIKKVVGL